MLPVHPLLFSTLSPQFNFCSCEKGVFELLEETGPEDRCRVQLESCVYTRGDLDFPTVHADPSGLASKILSNVSILTMNASSWDNEHTFFTRWCPAVKTLYISGSSRSALATEILPGRTFPRLTELRLSLYTPDWRSLEDQSHGLEPVERRIINQIRTRNNSSEGGTVSPITRLVLYQDDHTVDDATLDGLREIVDVDVCSQGDYVKEQRELKARALAEWWSVDPHPLRAWLSASAARCPGCNGDLEAKADIEDPEEDRGSVGWTTYGFA